MICDFYENIAAWIGRRPRQAMAGWFDGGLMEAPKTTRGRPRKFGRPSRAVTLTLPEDVIDRLRAVDPDVGRAVVQLIEGVPKALARPRGPAEISRYGSHSVILVKPVHALRTLPGVQLVPLPTGQALISLRHPQGVPGFELAIRDRLDSPDVEARERPTLQAVADILRRARLTRRPRVEARTIIVLESGRARRSAL